MKPRAAELILYPEFCKGCGICIEMCPLKVLAKSGELTEQGYYPVVLVQPDRCTGCRVCEIVCPDIAIDVVVKRSAPRQ